MYIRRTQNSKKKDGGHYYTYRIVESQRIGKKVQQRTLLNLGVDFSLAKEQWPILTKRIQEIFNGQQPLFEIECDIERLAQNFAARIIAKKQDDTDSDGIDYREINVDSLEVSRLRSVGCEHVLLEVLRELGLDTQFTELGFNAPQAALAIGAIIGRACHPASERETHRWLQDQSGLGELLDHDFGQVKLHKMYQVADQLLKKKSAIEHALYQKERNIFSLQETITLYDLTNTYFEGRCLNNTLAKRGHSKEKRTDCPLVTLGLVLDSSGFPKRSHVYKGNVSEAATLSEMIQDLQQPGLPEDQKPTVIMDAGIATQENIDWLKNHQYPYLVVSRKKYREFNEEESTIVKMDNECTVKVQKVFDEQNNETLLYCHSSLREEKERAIGQRFSTRFEDALHYLNQGLPIKRRLKKYDKVVEKIGRLKQQFSKAAKLYTVSVEKDDKSGNACKITWQRNPDLNTTDTYPGVYCLRTSQTDWDEKTLWKTYTMLTDLEAVFRSLKSELGLRPVHHQIADRVSGHLFITVLAYHLVHAIRYRLKLSNIHDSWTTLRNILLPHSRVTVSMYCKNRDRIHVRKSMEPEPEQQKIYSLLGVKSHPGKVIKTTLATRQNERCSAREQS
jgi:transposase